MPKTRVGILGSGFVTGVHLEAFKFVPDAEVVACFSRDREKAKAFAERHNIRHYVTEPYRMMEIDEVDVVVVALPNFLHAPLTIAAAAAGKHVIVEKPLCLTLAEADQMIEACRKAGVKLMYGEQLCFAPKYERVRQLAQSGALGRVHTLKQAERHFGPHSDWFWNVDQSGGGALVDLGCHAFGWFRWMLGGGPKVKSVQAHLSTLVHKERTTGDDTAVAVVEFENGVIGVAEDSWAKPGGMDDRIEVYGSGGVSYADLFIGNSALTYSEKGYDYALEKAGGTQGWSFTVFEEVFNQGYPYEMQHFIDCVRNDKPPRQTGEDGKAVMEMLFAAYHSAGTGRKVEFPFTPPAGAKHPADLWLNPRQG